MSRHDLNNPFSSSKVAGLFREKNNGQDNNTSPPQNTENHEPHQEKFTVPDISGRLKKEPSHRTILNIPQKDFQIIEEWLHEHPGHTLQSMFFCGLKSMGVDIDPQLMVPKVDRSYRRHQRQKKNQE